MPPLILPISSPIMVPTREQIVVPIVAPDDASAHPPPIPAVLETMSSSDIELQDYVERLALKILIILSPS